MFIPWSFPFGTFARFQSDIFALWLWVFLNRTEWGWDFRWTILVLLSSIIILMLTFQSYYNIPKYCICRVNVNFIYFTKMVTNYLILSINQGIYLIFSFFSTIKVFYIVENLNQVSYQVCSIIFFIYIYFDYCEEEKFPNL